MAPTIILITGANSGVGFATSKVLACASDSFHIIMTGRSHEKVKTAMAEIKTAGIKGTLSTLQLDVTNQESIKQAVGLVQQEFGRLDVLVNNAAMGCVDPDIRTRFKICLETNVMGPAMVAEAFRSLLFKSENPYSIYITSGRITLVRNVAQNPPHDDHIQHVDAYIVSKAALNMLTVLEAGEYGPKGLKVFAMSPGFVRSNLRGPSEEARSGWGEAGDPEVSGETVLSIVQGKRDADIGCFVHKDGVYAW